MIPKEWNFQDYGAVPNQEAGTQLQVDDRQYILKTSAN